MSNRATAADYRWFQQQYGDLETYCFTLVHRISPGELLQALGAEPQMRVVSVDALRQPAQTAILERDQILAGVTSIGEWSLMVEIGGFLGALDEAMRPLSKGRTVVSNQRGISGECYFSRWHDGALCLRFDHVFAGGREGTHPDDYLTDMRESGYDIRDDDEVDSDMDLERQFAAGFALSERITGIELTSALFTSAEFVAGEARWQDL